MKVARYLLVRGWTRDGTFPGGGDRWVDPLGLVRPHHMVDGAVREHWAHQTQLDRDAEARDHVDEHRPRLWEREPAVVSRNSRRVLSRFRDVRWR